MSDSSSIVYIVDDDVSVRRALGLLLKTHGFRVETFDCAKEFLAFRHLKKPSCLILDIQLPDINGLKLQEMMEQKGLAIPIIFITGHGDIPMSVKGMKAGAVDFLPKPFTRNMLLNAITQAVTKDKNQNNEKERVLKIRQRINTLTPREQEVFRLVAKGMLSKQIAYKCGTVLQTIKVHRGRVMQKMQARNVTELVQFAQMADSR